MWETTISNEYFTPTSVPGTSAALSSATMRAEFTSIGAGFDKLPALSGNANKAVVVNAGGTSLTVTTGALSLAGAFTLTGGHALTITTTGTSSITVPTSGTLATLDGIETLTNKTLTSPIITTSPTAAGSTWTNLGTVTTADINGGTIDGAVIGGSSAAAGSFTTLNSSGNATLGDSVLDSHTVNGQVTIQDNSAVAIVIARADVSGDRMRIGASSAGSGSFIDTKNDADTGYAPSNIRGSSVLLSYESSPGVATVGLTVAASTGLVTVAQGFTVNGNTTLGDASGDTLTINAGTWTFGNTFVATRAYGTLGAGSVTGNTLHATFAGDAGGTTNLSGAWLLSAVSTGANAITTARSVVAQLSHGAANTLNNLIAFTANGIASGSGNVTALYAAIARPQVTGAGNVTTANSFFADTPNMTSSGVVTTLNAFRVANQGNALVTTAVGVKIDDFTASTTMRGIWSSLSSGSGKHNLYIDGTADNYIAGRIGVGNTPTDNTFVRITGSMTSGGAGTSAQALGVFTAITGAAGDTAQLSELTVNGSITTQGVGDTISVVASAYLVEPNITLGSGDAVTTAATLYIASAPTEGTSNSAIYVASGVVRFLDGVSTNTLTVVSGTTATVFNVTATTVNAFGAATTLAMGAGASASATLSFTTGIALNTAAITSNQTTVALLNATVTTLNLGGAATTIAIGAATSDTTWTGQSFTLTGANSTDNTVLTVTNTSNAAAASHSYVDISVGGTTSTGDPHVRFTVPGGTSWYVGVDNSDSDFFKIGTGTDVGTNQKFYTDGNTFVLSTGIAMQFNGAGTITLSGGSATVLNLFRTTQTTIAAFEAATILTIGAATSATTWTGQSFTLTGANGTSNSTLTVTNSSNTAIAAHSIADIRVGGTTSTGDPQLRLTIPGGTSWYIAADNSDSDILKIGTGTTVGTNTLLSLTGAGVAGFTNKIYPGTDGAAAQTAAGLYAGSGAPNNANGSDGDFYFRSDGTVGGNTVAYHKEGGTWTAFTTA